MATIKKVVAKKPLAKAQKGGAKKKETPFQEGVRKKDFKASDTSYVSKYNKNIYSDNQKVMADEAPKTTKGSKDYNKKLDDAYKKTYGYNNVASMALGKRTAESRWPTKESEYRSIPNKTLWWEKKGDKKKMGGATKPKAQLGAIVKAIGKGISTGAKVANKGIKAAKAEKFAKETAHLKRSEDWAKYYNEKPEKLVKKVVVSAAGAGTGYVAGKAVMNKKKK